MKMIINGRNIALTDGIKQHVEEKMERLDQHYDFIKEIHVFLSVEKNPRIEENQVAEATIHVNRAILRVEAASTDLYGSVDALVDKIDRSLRKHKTKLLSRHHDHESIRKQGFEEAVAAEQEISQDPDDAGVYVIFQDDESAQEEAATGSAKK